MGGDGERECVITRYHSPRKFLSASLLKNITKSVGYFEVINRRNQSRKFQWKMFLNTLFIRCSFPTEIGNGFLPMGGG